MPSSKSLWTLTVVLLPWISGVYPRNYVPRFRTTQLLQVQKGQYVELSFRIEKYHRPPRSPCVDEEYLEIRDGHNQSANLLGVFCGDEVSGIQRSSGRSMWLKFSPVSRYWFGVHDLYYSGKTLNETGLDAPSLALVKNTQFVLFNHSSSLWCPAEDGPAPHIVWRKNGVIVKNNTSVRYRLTITEEEKNSNYCCEVNTHGGVDQKNISLVIERCPEPCQCTVLEGNMEGFVSVDCEGKQLHSVPQNIPVATIKLDLSGNKLKKLSSGVFSENSELLDLSLSNNQLQFLPKGVFSRNSKLVKLNLTNNKLESLPTGIFQNKSKLQSLDLSKNELQNLSSGMFQNNSGLRYLYLSNNYIKNLPSGVFIGLGRIHIVDLSNNQLKHLTSGAFRGLEQLDHLHLSNNQLKDLPLGVFKNTRLLDRLDLSYNHLEQLPPDGFSAIEYLEELFLNNNNLKSLSSNFLPKETKWDHHYLKNLTLDFNKLESLPHDVFKFIKLLDLWLGNNKFKELPEELLAGQDELRYLRLGGNQLKQLPKRIFKDLSDLEKLDLSYNHLQKLPWGVLSNNTKLKELDLSNNNIQRLPSDVFNNVTQLKKLFMSNNKLRQLPSFNNLSQLTALYMSNNSLSTLAPDQFHGLSNLADLAVYDNKIKYLPPRVFEGAKNLMSMSFHLNNIPSVSNVLFEDVAPSIRFMYFHYNEMRVLPEGFFANMKELITATVDTNLMCCHLAKEDADCDFVYVDSFASCESMFRNPAPRKCIWVIGILSLVGAVFVIVWRLVFKEKKKKNKIQSIMLMHLGGSDRLMGVYLIIVGVMDAIWSGQYFLHDFEWRSSLSCQITGAIAVLSSEVSVMLISLLSADRVKNIVFPYRGRSLSCKVTHILCIAIWVTGCIIAFLPTVGLDYFGSHQEGHHFYGRSVVCLPLQLSSEKPAGWEYSVAMFVGLNFSLVFFVIVAYAMILYNSCASSWRMAQQGTKREKKARSNAALRRRETALAKRVFIIILTDCLCWLPIVVIGMRSLLEKSFSTPGDLTVWIAVFVLPINSAINPILYTFSTPQVRGILKPKFQQFWTFLMEKCGRTANNDVQNQEEAESDDSDEESEEVQSEPELHAEPSGDHEEPGGQQEGEPGRQGEAKEEDKQRGQKERKSKQGGQKEDHKGSEKQLAKTDQRKRNVDPKEFKKQKVEPEQKEEPKEDHGKAGEQQVEVEKEKESEDQEESEQKTEEDTDHEPAEHKQLITYKVEEGEPDGDFPATTGRGSPRAPLATFDDDPDLDEPAEQEKLIIDKDNPEDSFPEATGRESPRAPLATFDDDHDLDEFMDMVQETVL